MRGAPSTTPSILIEIIRLLRLTDYCIFFLSVGLYFVLLAIKVINSITFNASANLKVLHSLDQGNLIVK